MLEKWGKKKGDVYVRRRRMRAKNRRQLKGPYWIHDIIEPDCISLLSEGEAILDVEEVEEPEEPEDIIEEQMFTFDKFEAVR